MSKKILLTSGVILALLFSLLLAEIVLAKTNVELENQYIRIVVNNSEADTGRFSVGTTGGDPDRDTDRNKHLIYGGDDPWTSYTTVRVGNQSWVFGNPTNRRAGRTAQYGEMLQEPKIINDTIQSAWRLGPLEVWQILSLARSSTTGLMDTARIEYEVKNTDTITHNVGLRLMLDTMLGSNDGAPFRAQDRAITSDTVYYAGEMPEFWQAFDSLADPQVISQGTLKGPHVTVPDRVYFTNWGSLADELWNFDFKPGRDFERKGEFELDSAIALFWDQVPLAPGESRNFVSHYGLGGVTIAPGELVLGVSAPNQITADAEGFQTFSIIAYVQNAGLGEARNVQAEIVLPRGLTLVGVEERINLGDLDVGETEQTGWQVRADSSVDGVLTYEVKVSAENSEPNRVERSIQIVSPAKLDVRFSGPIGISIKDEKYEPALFEAKAVVKNVGGAPAYGGSFEISLPIGLELGKGQNSKIRTGSIEPGEELPFKWLLKPTGVSGETIPYHLVISSSAGQDGITNYIMIPELKPKVWFGQPLGQERPIQVGDIFSISLWATNVRDFVGAEVDLGYDPELLEIRGGTLLIERGTLFTDQDKEPHFDWDNLIVNNAAGRVLNIKGERDDSLQRSYGTLITIHFRAKKAGTAAITVDSLRVWDENRTVPCEAINREITIQP
ncbi:MAG: hypothetical protein GX335_05830 [Firmicutes bacterium]|nr:hypothetical protein [Bacillota bacterium]